MTTIGIDFGTTNSVISVYGADGPEPLRIDEPPDDWAILGFDQVMPTILALGHDGKPRFGWAAKTSHGEKIEAVKRLFREEDSVVLEGQSFAVEEIATMLFSFMKSQAAAAGIDASQAVVTVPANSRGLARYRTRVCASMAGLEVLALINEPTAAAMAHSLKSTYDQRLMVVDWGGGTLDVTILQASEGIFVEQASKGIQRLGGLDFDARLAQLVLESVPDADQWTPAQKAAFRLSIERAKILLSTQDLTNVVLPTGEIRQVTRERFTAAVQPLVDQVRAPIQQCLTDLRADPDLIDAVVLVGGTCNVPAVRDVVGDIMGKEASRTVDPLTAVAEGAAIAAAILSGDRSENDFFVATEHALGTYALDSQAVLRFSTVIPRNHKLPARATETYFPVHDEQTSVNVQVVEGDPGLAPGHEDNVVLQQMEVPLPPRSTIGDKAIDITYEYDVEGILHVSVGDHMTGEVLIQDDVTYGVGVDKRKLVAMATRARNIAQDGVEATSPPVSEDPEVGILLHRAKALVIPFLPSDEAQPVREAADALERASSAQTDVAKANLSRALQPYSYLF